MAYNEVMDYKFPDGFLWGSATSAHQVEGGNFNDWTIWEKENAARLAARAAKRAEPWPDHILSRYPNPFQPENYISGKACDHYNSYEEDFDIAKSLGQNAHRFSIEWSRIEPEEGKFKEAEIEHYRKVILALRSRGIEPFVTLWHWTNPVWISEIGGPENKKFPFYFSRYAKYVVDNLENEVKYWFTLNEPTSVILNSYQKGSWPPQKKSLLAAQRVFKNLSAAHNIAYDSIKSLNNDLQVGFNNILSYFEPANKNSWADKVSMKIAEYFGNKKFLRLTKNKHDFFAVQYYMYAKIKFPLKSDVSGGLMSDLGWEIYPEGLLQILKSFKRFGKPVFITENGLADAKDDRRAAFIKGHLKSIHDAIQYGVNVRGYFYWSLLDNFEWAYGFWPRFGLVEIDYKTMERKIRPSALEYAKICKENFLSF